MALAADESLALIRSAGTLNTTLDELSARWGTEIAATRKRLQRWEQRGLVKCSWPGGKMVTVQWTSTAVDVVDTRDGVDTSRTPNVDTPVDKPTVDTRKLVDMSTNREVDRVDRSEPHGVDAQTSTNQRAKKPKNINVDAYASMDSETNLSTPLSTEVVAVDRSVDTCPRPPVDSPADVHVDRSTTRTGPPTVHMDTSRMSTDPMVRDMTNALESLATEATQTRMPVPRSTGGVLAMVTGTTGRVPAPAQSRLHFRLRLPNELSEPRDWRIGKRMIAVAAAALGAYCAVEAWEITTWYGHQIATDPTAQRIYAKAGQIFVLANVLVPVVCGQLAADGHFLTAWIGRLFWLSTIVVFCLLASAGFSARNLSDTTAVREAAAKQRQAIEARRETKVRELAALPAARAVEVVEVALQQAQPKVLPSIWRSSKGCADVTAPTSGEACAEVLRLRQEQATSAKRNQLSKAIEAADLELAEAPKIADADPQLTVAARLINRLPWVSGTTEDVKDLRISSLIIGIEILPPFLFTAASALWFGRRRRRPWFFKPRISE